ncbi:unannotated protein [freshwater metagenome]|uniref:Unannotated protein n=1 Tax=freshwater metagenome TaxID=449393 RepID=A0A6J7D6T8_9ZZZZ
MTAIGSKIGSKVGMIVGPASALGSIWPDNVIVLAASNKPSIIEPVSPIKMRAR